ncbi:GNAT family N-acetyltransferase [Microbacterium sp. LMI12-1-1.1]|uniref:GNAT family N-acetyltransferase n=1 Tax=Microbacterium sp. LMI12-1-1.1 TaxID=3135225 RepID=UPI003434B7D0
MGVRVVAATEAGWDAVDAVMQADASSRNCQCQFHILENADARLTTRQSRRDLLHEQVRSLDPPRGLVAFDGDAAVGWCGVEPRVRVRHVLASRLVRSHSLYAADDPGVWAIYCILVPPARRRGGVGAALLAAALAHAVERGATALEGYPIDTSRRGGQLPAGFSTGTVAMFDRHGFAAVAALPSARTLMHRLA